MAGAISVPPILSLRRSAQSGTKAMAATWTVVYSDQSATTIAYLFSGARINLSTMQAGDHIDIRVRKQVLAGGAWSSLFLRRHGVSDTRHPSWSALIMLIPSAPLARRSPSDPPGPSTLCTHPWAPTDPDPPQPQNIPKSPQSSINYPTVVP